MNNSFGASSTTMAKCTSEAISTATAASVTTKAGKRPVRALSPSEKLSAIARVHEGESKASVARDIGVPESTLRGWCKNEAKITSYARQQSASPESDGGAPRAKKPRTTSDPGSSAAAGSSSALPFSLTLRTRNSGPTSRQSYSPLTDASPAVAQGLSRNATTRQSPPAAHTPARHLHMNGGTASASGTRTDELSAGLRDPVAAATSNSALARMAADMAVACTAGFPVGYDPQLLSCLMMQQSYMRPNLAASSSNKKSSPLNIDTANNGHRLTSSPVVQAPGGSLLTTVPANHQAQRSSSSKDTGLTMGQLAELMEQQRQMAITQTYLQQLSNSMVATTSATTGSGVLAMATSPGLTGATTGTGNIDSPYSAAFTRMMSDRLINLYRTGETSMLHTAASSAGRVRKRTMTPPTVSAPANVDDKQILYQQLTRTAEDPRSEAPSAAAATFVAIPKKTPEYVEEEQEVAEDLSTGKRSRTSTSSIPLDTSSSSSAGSPASGLTSSMSIPSPTNPTTTVTSSPTTAFPPMSPGSSTAAHFGSDSEQHQHQQNGKVSARKTLKPRRQLNTVLARLENRTSESVETQRATEQAAPGDWRAAVNHGEAFVRWLESIQDPTVTSFQVNTVKGILTNITKSRQSKEGN